MDYIGRKTWGARYAPGTGARPIPCAEAWLHHTVTTTLPVDATPEQERVEMRKVEAIGQSRFGSGFSYNLAIFPSGRVYVGCGVRRVGTHTGGRNTKALGIVLVGDYSKHPMSGPMQAALVEVLRDAKRLGWLREARLNGGHRDLKATGCPGDHAYRLIPDANRKAAGTDPAAPTPDAEPTPNPAPTPAPNSPGDDAMLIVLHSDGHRQFVCSFSSARHIGMPERNVLVAGGVPYVGENEASAADRAEFLRARGVE